MRKRILTALLIMFVVSSPAFAMGFPGPQDPNRPEEVDDTKVDATNYPFSISIDKPSIDLITEPGSTNNGEIAVENNGTKPLLIRVYAADWIYSEDGSKTFHKAGSTKHSCAGWMHLNPKELLLEPLGTEDIKYIMTTPKDASGSHVAVIFFEGIFEEQDGIALGGRIGSIVYQETKGKSTRSGEIKKLNVESGTGKAKNFQVTFKNTGNCYTNVMPQVEIYSQNGQKMEGFAMPMLKTLPNDEVVIEEEYLLSEKGDYKAVVTIDLGDKTLKKAADFSL
ncbi:hypothetical protein ACFLZ2_04195 [Candidatus Margulisiibacteriota bacterium]